MSDDDVYRAHSLACSLPLVKLASQMRQLGPGELFEFSTDNPCFEDDLRLWCRQTGHRLCNIRRHGGTTQVVLMKRPDEERYGGESG